MAVYPALYRYILVSLYEGLTLGWLVRNGFVKIDLDSALNHYKVGRSNKVGLRGPEK